MRLSPTFYAGIGAISGPTCQMSGFNYAEATTYTTTLVSLSPLRVTLTTTHTITGNSTIFNNCGGVTHTATSTVSLAGKSSTNFTTVPPNYYINLSASLTLDSAVDSCLIGAGCSDTSSDQVFCSFIGHNVFQEKAPPLGQVEVAFTQVKWGGSPAPSCDTNGACIYAVNWNCTAATTPPDYQVGSVKSGDYVGIATDLRWRALSPCIRIGTSGPWGCYAGLFPLNSWLVATNDPLYPLYACTHHP